MKTLHEKILVKIGSECDKCVKPSLYTDSVSITEARIAVNHLKNYKYNIDGTCI